MNPSAAEVVVRGSEVRAWMRKRGWWFCDEGMRHKGLDYVWPIADALKVQHEADEGGQELVHRLLRGEA